LWIRREKNKSIATRFALHGEGEGSIVEKRKKRRRQMQENERLADGLQVWRDQSLS
jgi:hypothetical protein